MSTEEETTATHSLEATHEVADAIHELLKEDEEGDLDVYDRLIRTGTKVTFRVTSSDDLEYLVTVEPIED